MNPIYNTRPSYRAIQRISSPFDMQRVDTVFSQYEREFRETNPRPLDCKPLDTDWIWARVCPPSFFTTRKLSGYAHMLRVEIEIRVRGDLMEALEKKR